MEQQPQKVAMIVGAHPDDPDFGAGGTVGKWIREGWKVIYVVCTNGDKGSSDSEMTSERLAMGLLPLVGKRFQVLFHSGSQDIFHLSLTVLVHYRSPGSI